MQLNKQTDYALRVLLYLAFVGETRLVNIDEIVSKFHILRNHLIKIISKLARLKFIITYRGVNGGMKINPETLDITLDQIIAAFEPTFEVVQCEHLVCPLTGMCRLKSVLDEASNNFVATLGKYKLSDMLPTNELALHKIMFMFDSHSAK
ncbi:MAG: Rrf2 family transcriptional regulator [Neisseriaceae bacterium]|nr:MAG: Rrf2 family transcriptional regulator [Neisseriaceae bacterium]